MDTTGPIETAFAIFADEYAAKNGPSHEGAVVFVDGVPRVYCRGCGATWSVVERDGSYRFDRREDPPKTFTVNLWGSDPDDENDDCWIGFDFDSEGAARAAFDAPDPIAVLALELEEPRRARFVAEYRRDAAYIQIDGPGVHEDRKLREPAEQEPVDMEWQNEIATQAGMMGGCDAYNDVMGYG